MIDTAMKQDEYEMLDALMLENNISLRELYYFAEQHMDKINEITDIFGHKTDRARRFVLELLGLLGRDRGDEIMARYAREFDFPPPEYLHGNFPREDVELLLAACLYNPSFLYFAQSIYGDVEEELEGEVKDKQPPFKRRSPRILKTLKVKFGGLYADVKGLQPFHKESLDINGICGTLYFEKNEQHDAKFVFQFEKAQETVPFELEVYFITKHDHEPHPVSIPADEIHTIKGKKGEIAAIQSDLKQGIDYSEGIEGDYYTVKAIQPDTP